VLFNGKFYIMIRLRFIANILRNNDCMSIQKTILLVDDDDGVLRVLRAMLIMNGYNVLSTSSTLEAIQIAESYAGEIHLFLVDVILAEINGIELSKKLSSIREKMPTLFISGYDNGIALSEHNFIRKPFLTKALISKVETTMTSLMLQ
jgi:DNA-binding NtrC family response regulator